jgi:capsular exopolysaccharide synthesis family protein
MALNDLLRMLWQRRLLVVSVAVAFVAAVYIGTKLVAPRYEATSTLAVSPKSVSNDLLFFGTLDAIMPVYADAANSRTTLDAAKSAIGGKLGSVSVETFKGTGLLKIHGRSTNARLARDTANSVAQSLVDRTRSGGVGVSSLKLNELDTAALPTTPVFPRTKLTLLIGALLGLGLGVGAAFLRENLTTKVETADELAKVSSLPVFAEIPAESRIAKLHSPRELVENPGLRVLAEALRDLRTNLFFTDETMKSIVVTSPEGSHGKTTVSFGLAATVARAGARTLLVDGDLRRGRIAQMLNLHPSPGLIDILLEHATLEDATVSSPDTPTLDVIPAGALGEDPGELLTVAFPRVLAQLEQEYDFVVIDSTPVVPISDARVVARFADATLLVAHAGVARRRQIRTAIERLALISVRPIAAVLNSSRAISESSYYIAHEGVPARTGRRAKQSRTATR